jgi:hypothetical protein
MSEHRGHLLPCPEEISCRGAASLGLRADPRQRIYRRPRSGQCRDLPTGLSGPDESTCRDPGLVHKIEK